MTSTAKNCTLENMKNSFWQRATRWLIRFIYLQLFVILIAVPILIAWGLPISLLSPLGNLLFGPMLTLFLFLSSLIFFTELIGIPNSIFITALEKTSKIWLITTKINPHGWLIGIAKPPTPFLFAIPLATLLIIHNKKITHNYYRMALLTILLLSSSIFFKFIARCSSDSYETVACNRGSVTLLYTNKQLTLIDPGVIGQRMSAPNWIEYSLIPHIIKTIGTTTIDHLILLQINGVLFEAVTILINKMHVKHIYLVQWDGTLPEPWAKKFEKLQQTARQQNVLIKRIGPDKKEIQISKTNSLIITPVLTKNKKLNLNYPVLTVTGQINNKLVTIHSYKHTKNTLSYKDKIRFCASQKDCEKIV